ncbi:MAG: ABC transporter ATP-binding protein, partial [Malacoplasma sp.]|nr:ABC transporter ATP-binding protein [Malacoplasma sp.]
MNKKEDLFYKVDATYFYLLNDALYQICNFNIVEYSNLIANMIVALICLIIATVFNAYFLLVVLVIVISQTLILLFSIGRANNIIKDNIKSSNINQSVASNYIDSKAMFLDFFKFKNMQQELNTCFENNVVNKTKESLYSNLVSTIKTIVTDLIFIITTFIGMLLISKDSNFSIGQMLFVINVICLFSTSIGDLGSFFLKNKIYEQFYNIYQSFIEINNIENKSIVTINSINNITIVNKDKYIDLKNGFNKIDLSYKELALHMANKKARNSFMVEINNYQTNHIAQNWLNSSICYWSELDQNDIKVLPDEKIVKNKLVLKTIQMFKLNPKSSSKQDKALYNLLNFVGESNKIIILDHYFSCFSQDYLNYVLTTILPVIQQVNYVIY